VGDTVGELTSGGRPITSQENFSLHSDVQCYFEMATKSVPNTKRVLLSHQTTAEKESLSCTLESGAEAIGQCIKIMCISFKEFTFGFECYGRKKPNISMPNGIVCIDQLS
jgi:hypothetical protein